MTSQRERFSLILPKIDRDHKEIKFIKEINSPNSSIREKEKLDLSFPSLLDNNNNNNNSKRGILEYKHVRWSPETPRKPKSALSHGTKKFGARLHEEQKPALNLNTEDIVGKLALVREKYAVMSPKTGRKLSHLHQDPQYLGKKCTICANKLRVRQKQMRVKNCTILKDYNEKTTAKFMQGIQRQDAIDIDEGIELGSIKKCCAWMDTWFTEEGKPKEETDDEDETSTG